MQILDAGTRSMSDHEVLTFIKAQLAADKATDTNADTKADKKFKRPGNYVRSLQRHRDHLEDQERPFVNNDKYDEQSKYISKLMDALEPKVQLTKTELLMLVNHRPHDKEFLLPLVEDIETRYTDEEQDWIVEQIVLVLGRPDPSLSTGGQADGDTSMADG